MRSKSRFLAMTSGVGCLRLLLPLLVLLHCGNALADFVQCPTNPLYTPPDGQNIPIDCNSFGTNCTCDDLTPLPCPGGTLGTVATYGTPPGATISAEVFASYIEASEYPPASVTWSPPASVPIPGKCSTNKFSQLSFSPSTPSGGTTGSELTIGGNLDTAGDEACFQLTATAHYTLTTSCPRNYYFHAVSGGTGWGDVHIKTTVDGVAYEFQAAGEVTALRGKDFELQTRQTPVATPTPTNGPGPPYTSGAYTGLLPECVSVYTGIATRVGKHKVSYQSDQQTLTGVASEMQLFVDDNLTKLPPGGIDLYGGDDAAAATVERRIAGRIVNPPSGDGIEIQYADGTTLDVTSGPWANGYYLTVQVSETTATEGIMGRTLDGWLPALPDGKSPGPKPGADPPDAPHKHERYVQLYETFADAWRVTDKTSLFHYPPGTSTQTFTDRAWPGENPTSCEIQGGPKPRPPIKNEVAEQYCSAVVDKINKANCVFDVSVMGEPSFGQTYHTSEQLNPGLTQTSLKDDRDPTKYGEQASFTATVAPTLPRGPAVPAGTVQFTIDESNAGKPVPLDSKGQAVWSKSDIAPGKHLINGNYIPSGWGGKLFLASSSPEVSHTVIAPFDRLFWFIVLLLIILSALILWWLLAK